MQTKANRLRAAGHNLDRDYQRTAVYRWEDGLTPRSPAMDLDQCKALAAQMYGKRVVVKDGRGTRAAKAYTSMRLPTIGLPLWARRPWVVAHEVAHLIAHRQGYGSGHGGRFVAVYIRLLATHCGLDAVELTASARAAGLKVIPED